MDESASVSSLAGLADDGRPRVAEGHLEAAAGQRRHALLPVRLLRAEPHEALGADDAGLRHHGNEARQVEALEAVARVSAGTTGEPAPTASRSIADAETDAWKNIERRPASSGLRLRNTIDEMPYSLRLRGVFADSRFFQPIGMLLRLR